MPIPSRRTFIASTVVVVAGGAGVVAQFVRHPRSGGRHGNATATSTTTATVPSRVTRLQKALTRERALVDLLAHAATTTPTLAARIAVLRADHQAHAAALADLITAAAGPTPSPSDRPPDATTSTTPTATSSGSVAAKPVTVAELARGEKAAAAAFGADFDSAAGPEAAVLASIYACEQTHVAWLS